MNTFCEDPIAVRRPKTHHSILVVDDHDVMRRRVSAIVESDTNLCVCGEAGNGEEAINEALRLLPDLIVMDILMPEMDGLTATAYLRKVAPEIPVVILALHQGQALVGAAQVSGARGFVCKREIAESLLEAIDVVLHGETFFGQASKPLCKAVGQG